MKFTCEKSTLQDANAIASRAVPSKSPISALEGLLLEAENGILRITGYDLKKAIHTEIEADVATPGVAVVNARFFSEMIRRMPDGLVTVSCDSGNNMKATCGRSEYDFIGLDYSEYPEMPRFSEVRSLEIPQNILRNMINRTIFAVSKEEIRPVYTGSLFEIENNSLTLVSVDGYRLARRRETIENSRLEDCSFVVPGFALSDIEKICGDSDDKAVISVGDKHISFSIGNTVVISRRLEGDFLNHRKSVPENFRFIVKVNRQELISVIDRVSLVLSEKNGNPVRLAVNDGGNLAVGTAGVEADAAAVEVTSYGSGRFAGNGSMFKVGHDDFKRVFIASCHESVIKVTEFAFFISFFDLFADDGCACDDDLVAASDPEESFYDTFDITEVDVIFSDAVLVYSGLESGNVTVVSFNTDNDVLTVFLGVFTEFAGNERHGGELFVENGLYFKLHNVLYLRL